MELIRTYMYKSCPIVLFVGLVVVILHFLNISIPYITMNRDIYEKWKFNKNDVEFFNYHRRHAISLLIIVVCTAIGVYSNVHVIIKIGLLFILYMANWFASKKDREL